MRTNTSTPGTSSRPAANSLPGRPPGPESIDYGSRARLGFIIASGNPIAEPQIRAMLPTGVQAYFTRLPLRGSSPGELLRMAGQVAGAATLLRDAGVDLVVFHCTAASTYSAGTSAAIHEQLQRGAGSALSFATSEAIVAAARALTARRLALLTPYVAAVNAREADFLVRHGFEVVREEGLGLQTNTEMARLPASAFVEQALRCRDDRVDAYFISCTAIRSAEVIEELEASLGRPVLTSNQAAVWHALRACGIRDAVAHFGALLRM